MKINGLQCDTCTRMYKINRSDFTVFDIPTKWFTLFQRDSEGDKIYTHFCSIQCLSDWTMKQAIVINDVKESKEG
jgi:hypothetical protein